MFLINSYTKLLLFSLLAFFFSFVDYHSLGICLEVVQSVIDILTAALISQRCSRRVVDSELQSL